MREQIMDFVALYLHVRSFVAGARQASLKTFCVILHRTLPTWVGCRFGFHSNLFGQTGLSEKTCDRCYVHDCYIREYALFTKRQ